MQMVQYMMPGMFGQAGQTLPGMQLAAASTSAHWISGHLQQQYPAVGDPSQAFSSAMHQYPPK
jgi:hypothetical protein